MTFLISQSKVATYLTGEVDKSIRSWCQIFSAQDLTTRNYWNRLIFYSHSKKIKRWTFFGTQCRFNWQQTSLRSASYGGCKCDTVRICCCGLVPPLLPGYRRDCPPLVVVVVVVVVHSESKKQDTKLLPITSPNVNRFPKFFHWQTH